MTPTTAQSLYRTWRSRTFGEVVGQGHITQTLRNAVRAGSVGHAYLLTGPRGTGKTSTARILARAVNCLQPRDGEPCNVCAPCQSILQNRCLDVMEIDAASKSKVDEMRDVIDKVGYAPTEVRRKVYVVDEVHMLSTHAFNALLKTIEEPPAHAIFLLATTDVHKVPTTITSRCQRLDFRTISTQDIVDRLFYVCEQEGLQAEPSALDVIARQATGSLRDALSLLEQVRAYEDTSIDVAAVEDALGLARSETLIRLADYIISGDAGGAITLISELAAAGSDMRQYSKQLVQYWRDLLLMRVGASRRMMGEGASDAATAAQAARLSPADITTVLKAILQPDYSGRRSASAQTQLELAVVEASTHFPSNGARPADGGVNGAQSSIAAAAPDLTSGSDTGGAAAPRPATPSAAPATRAKPAAAGRAQDRGNDSGSASGLSIPSREGRTTGTGEQRGERPVLPDHARAMPSTEPTNTPGEAVGQARPVEDAPVRRPGTAQGAEAPVRKPMQRTASVDSPGPATVDEPAHEQHQVAPARLDPRDVWARVRQHPSVKGRTPLTPLLELCVPDSLEDDAFVLLFDARNKFQQDRVMAHQNRAVIEEALAAVVGRPVALRCDTLRQQSPRARTAEYDPTSDTFVDDAERRLRAIHVSR